MLKDDRQLLHEAYRETGTSGDCWECGEKGTLCHTAWMVKDRAAIYQWLRGRGLGVNRIAAVCDVDPMTVSKTLRRVAK
jgi:hypothetical protein